MDETKLTTLRTEGLVKRYGKRTVANGVSINVKQGEIVGLLGPNGAGKTTSFYMTTGLVVPNEGHVYMDDTEITDYPVYKRAQAGIGYMTMNAREFLQTDIVLVGILLYALLGKLADVLAVALERYLLRWHAGYQK